MKPVTTRRRSGTEFRNARDFYIFLLPALVGLGLFTLGPILASLVLSFTDWSILHPPSYIGLRNYQQMVQDPLFWKALTNTLVYLLSVPLTIAVALATALLLNGRVYLMPLFRTLFYLPSIVSAVALAYVFQWVLNPEFGPIGTTLSMLNLPAPAWLTDPNWLKPAFILMAVYGSFSNFLVFLAGLNGVPQEVLEAAAIDGAGPIRRFRSIVWPLLTPTTFFVLITTVIASFQVYTQAAVLLGQSSMAGGSTTATPGGVEDAALFYVVYIYGQAFSYLRAGYASALAWVLFALIMIVTAILFRFSESGVYYDA